MTRRGGVQRRAGGVSAAGGGQVSTRRAGSAASTRARSPAAFPLRAPGGNRAFTSWIHREADTGPQGSAQGDGRRLFEEGLAHLRAKSYDEAALAFRGAYDLTKSHRALLNLGSALFDGKRFAEAIVVYELYLQHPSPRRTEARAQIARARKLKTAQAAADFDQARAAYASGNYEEAFTYFERVYLAVQHADIRYNQAASLHRWGRLETALEYYELYLGQKPSAPDAGTVRAAMAKIQGADIPLAGLPGAREYMKRGVRLLRAKDNDAAVLAFEAGYRTHPSAAFLLNKAAALSDGGRWAEAVLAYERYLSDPEAAAGGRLDDARTALERARQHLGGREATATGVETSYKRAAKAAKDYADGEYLDALHGYDVAYELNPLAGFRYNQGACLHRLGRRSMAITRYEMYLTEKPDADDAKQVRRMIATLKADVDTATRQAFDAGQAAYVAGDYRAAAAHFLDAFEHSGTPDFLFNRAAALDKAGDKADAIRAYAWYLKVKPSARDADKVRARIRVLQAETGTELMVP